MEQRKEIEVVKDVIIDNTSFESKRVNKEKLLKTINTLSDTDEILGIAERSGWHEPGFGSMDGEPVFYCHFAVVIRNYRLETDEEYFRRMKELEETNKQFNERERLEYLRLKAKFGNKQE